VREIEWANGWLPELVVSSSVLPDCVFIAGQSWEGVHHSSRARKVIVEMLKIVPGLTACRLNIQ
jgi:hypothetical protein